MAQQPTSFDAELARLTDDARRAEARDARRRRADRSVAASLSASFDGTLVELLETGSPATFMTRSGAHVRGTLQNLSAELVVIASASSSRTLIPRRALEAVRETGSGHDRDADAPAGGPALAEVLDLLAQERARLAITLDSRNRVMGMIERVGFDQVVLRLDGESDVLTIPLGVIDHVVSER